jgi:GNAT superfamily N-acetyltransferase
MTWTLTPDVAEYLAASGDFLAARAAENTVLLTAAENIRCRAQGHPSPAGQDAPADQGTPAGHASPPPLFGWWAEPGGGVTGAFLHTPPYGLALATMPAEVAAALAGALAGAGHFPGGVGGDTGTAQAFAAAWQRQTGQPASIYRRSRLYRLGRLRSPDPDPPGHPRLAVAADRDLVVAWLQAFSAEADPASPATTVGQAADDLLSFGGLTFWETGDGPVSLAGRHRAAAGQVRVGPVYTPPDRRGQGFGGAVTAAVSKAARDAGVTEVVLFTDLANPTSNALYQRLGYEPVIDHLMLTFSPGRP